MRALTLTEVKAPLQLMERSDLEPAAGEVIVRLRSAALNRRDYWITQGMYPGIDPPVVLGSDGAGVVEKCGPGVDASWKSAEVVINPGMEWGASEAAQDAAFHILGLPRDGTFADQVAVPVTLLHQKPTYLSWAAAGAFPLGGVTAYRALFSQGDLQAGERVLVTGIGGGVATFALQFAVAAGAEVWVTSSSQDKIDRAVELGARGGFDYRTEKWWKQMASEVGSPNLVIDSAGGRNYGDLVNLVAPGGRIVNYGATTGPPERLDMFKVFWKQLRLIGSTMGSPTDFEQMLAFATQHEISPCIDREVTLEETGDAVASMSASPQFGKIVINIS